MQASASMGRIGGRSAAASARASPQLQPAPVPAGRRRLAPPPPTAAAAAAAIPRPHSSPRRRRPAARASAAAEPQQQQQQQQDEATDPTPTTTAATANANDNDDDQNHNDRHHNEHRARGPAPQIVSPRREAREAAADYAAVYDRLISLFESRPREDWKKLVVFSAQWSQHRQGVFDRLRARADAEPDVDARVRLRRLYRQLQGVDGEVGRYNACLQRFLDADEHEWEAVVAQHRGDLQRAFFEHLQCLIVAAARDEQQQQQAGGGAAAEGAEGAAGGGGGQGAGAVKAAAEAVKAAAERAKRKQEADAAAAIGGAGAGKGFGGAKGAAAAKAANAANAANAKAAAAAEPSAQAAQAATTDPSTKKERLIAVNARLLALVANHDSVAADTAGLERAAEAYRDVLASAKSVEDVDRAVERLASQGRIDPAFLQISARAYGAARDTQMTLDEAKWVAYRMYVRARDHFDRQQPQEKRILEYLVSLRDRGERSRLLDQAVTPGPTRATDSHDYLYSTPARLYKVLDGTLKAWEEMQRGAQRRMGVSERASTPRRVVAMRELRDEIRRRYL